MKGSIQKRGKASWRLKFDLPLGPDGKRRTQFVTVRGGKKIAQAKLAELLASVGKGAFVEPSRLTVAEHVGGRIAVWHAAGTIGNATRERYNTLLKRQVTPHIGDVILQKLSTKDVEAWHGKLRTTGLAPRTVRHAHRLLAKALRDGVRHGLVSRSVAGRDGQQAPTVVAEKPEIIRADQIGDVVAKLRGSDIFPHAMLALFGGLRAGEVLALKWSSVDFDGKLLVVKESVEEIAGQPLAIKAPKTEAGVRKVSMPDVVVDALRDHRRKQLEARLAMGLGRPANDVLVFPALDGGLTRRTALSIGWAKTVAALGLPRVTYHQLRHSHASMLIAAKLDLATIADRMGHANPSVTLKIYAHMFEKNDAAAADAINAALGASSVPKTR
jgi:integrase